MDTPIMNFKVVPYDYKTIEIQKMSVDTFQKDNVVIIKIPKGISPVEIKEFVGKIKLAFPSESLVIVGHDVEFARLVDIDKF